MEEQLNKYVELLLKWNKKINLISPSTEADVWQRHIEDSLQLNDYIPKATNLVIDLGSGGGLPGIPLAISGHKVVMIESDMRKSIFLKTAKKQLELDYDILNERVETADLNLTNVPSDIIITCRAFAPMKKIFDLTNSFIAKNLIEDYKFLLLKGENVSRETLEAEKKWHFDMAEYPSKTNPNSCILEVSNIKKKT